MDPKDFPQPLELQHVWRSSARISIYYLAHMGHLDFAWPSLTCCWLLHIRTGFKKVPFPYLTTPCPSDLREIFLLFPKFLIELNCYQIFLSTPPTLLYKLWGQMILWFCSHGIPRAYSGLVQQGPQSTFVEWINENLRELQELKTEIVITWHISFTTQEEAVPISEPPSKGSEEVLVQCVAPASEMKAKNSLSLDIPVEESLPRVFFLLISMLPASLLLSVSVHEHMCLQVL